MSDLRNLDGLDVEYATGDLTDAASVRGAVAGCDVVFHGAADYRLFARGSGRAVSQQRRRHAQRPDAAAEAASSAGLHQLGRDAGARPHDGVPADETAAASASLDDMVGDYKRCKFLAEREVIAASASAACRSSIVNPSTPVGDGDIKPTPTGQIILDFLQRPDAGLRRHRPQPRRRA